MTETNSSDQQPARIVKQKVEKSGIIELRLNEVHEIPFNEESLHQPGAETRFETRRSGD